MSKIDIKAIIKDLKKNELTELISVAQEVLSTLFNSSEIRENVKESRFSKGYECPKCQCKDVNKNGKSNGRSVNVVVQVLMSLLCLHFLIQN